MTNLLNLLAAIALLVWGTHLVRKGVLQVCGVALRNLLARSAGNRWVGFASGFGVAALVQSSTATALIAASFVGQGLLSLPLALAIMLGADVGTGMMAVLFSFDLSWLSPLLILVGVMLFLSRQTSNVGRLGRTLIGLGLMLLALRLVSASTAAITSSPAVHAMLGSLTDELMLAVLFGALMTVVAYSSLAVVLLTAAMAASEALPLQVGLALVLGANLGSGLLAVLTTTNATLQARQVPLGNLFFKVVSVVVVAPLIPAWFDWVEPYFQNAATAVVTFHLSFNLAVAIVFIGLTGQVARLIDRCMPAPVDSPAERRLSSLDPSALGTPSLAISCAARECMRQADVVEIMLVGVLEVIKNRDLNLAQDLRKLDDTVDQLHSAIKYYLTKISREALDEGESRRWADIISFSINMEQIGDVIERVLIDVEDRKISKARSFSAAGMAEIVELHTRLMENLHLGMSVFLNGSVRDAQKLLEAKTRFRDLEHAFAATHLRRLMENTASSIETSSLHIDLISDLKRINSHICSIAYPILESAGALAPSRLRSGKVGGVLASQ